MEEAQIVVDVEASPLSKSSPLLESSPLSESMQRELDTLRGTTNEARNCTIFRTPHIISQGQKNLFQPSAISIGPFHHGQKHLRAMEEQKWRFLQDFLSREDHISLDLCISEMKLLEKRTRGCYSETFDDLSSDEFIKMMLLDGCFVFEYFTDHGKVSNSIDEAGWNSNFIQYDLLLLENQIPFFIVKKLCDIGLNPDYRRVFVKSIVCLSIATGVIPNSIFSDPPGEISDPIDYIDSIIPDPPAEIHHLVHLSYHYLVPNPEKPVVLSSKSFDLTRMFSANRIKGLLTRRFLHSTSRSLTVALPNSTKNISLMVIPSATELKQKGMKFTQKSNPKHMLDISFEYGVLEIPGLTISDDTKPVFANLIAFEHSKYAKENRPFTMFVAFLDNLINTPNDVTILQQCGIIENWLGSEEELANFINQITFFNFYKKDHYLAELYTEVNKYSESSWNRHRAKLVRDYFSSPWTAISLVAALILLVLTCVQSFYAVYAYKFPPRS